MNMLLYSKRPRSNPMKKPKEKKIVIWDDILMMILAVASGVFLVLELTTNPSHTQSFWYETADLAIASIFLTEFIISLVFSSSRLEYFKSNWWYLLAAIPVTDHMTQGLRMLRLLRLARLVRLVRVVTGTKEIWHYLGRYSRRSHAMYASVILVIVIFYGAIIFHALENPVNSNITSVQDSLRWVAATVTTVGYGDVHPTTTGGRVVGVTLVTCGIAIIGIFTAFFASFFFQRSGRAK
jgi:voltage-gated potassium channel